MNASSRGRPAVDALPVLLRRRVTLLTGALYLLAAVAMTQVSRLNTLGYESALLFGLIAAWIGGILPLRLTRPPDAKHVQAAPADGGGDRFAGMLRDWLRLSATGALLLLPPMAVLTGNAAFVRNCAMFEGALFWLLIPFGTVLFSAALVLFLRALFGRSAGVTYYLVLLLLLVQPVLQIFTRPQIYAYNHVFGMFLGLSWDQTQPPFLTLLMYRASTLAYAGMLLAVASVLRRRARTGTTLHSAVSPAAASPTASAPATASFKASTPAAGLRRGAASAHGTLFLVSLITALVFFFFSDELGFTNSYPHLRAELGAAHRAGDVLIVYDSASLSQEEIRLIADEHRFQLERVCAALDVRWEGTLTSYLYPDSNTKKRLLGTESSELARPWRREIHISEGSWQASLKHELVHVVAGSFGPYINRAPFLRVLGLTEGLAMAVEWSWGNRTLHQHAAAMKAQDLLPTAERCLSTMGFVTGSSSVSYVAAGSVTRWMIDTLGMDVIRRAYAADDIEGVTGMTYGEIDRRWRAFLGTVTRARPDSIATAYAFRRPSLFTAVCPRVVTERTRDAAAALARRDAARALTLYRDIERMAPNARAVFGIVSSLYQLGMMDSVRQASRRWLGDGNRAYSVYPLQLWLGAAAWAEGDSAAADQAFSRLLRERLPGWTTGMTERMRRILRCCPGDTVLRGIMLAALQREENEDSLREMRSGLLRERLGHDHANGALFEEWARYTAVDSAGRATVLRAAEQFPAARMHRELRMLIGRIWYRQASRVTAYERAERMFRSALEITDCKMDRLETEEWINRCLWKRAQFP